MNIVLVKFIQWSLKVYHWLLSPLLGNRCRFVPSCSVYAHQALSEHGLLRGLGLTAKRLARCHPWGGSGLDPVPTSNANKQVHRCCNQVQLDTDLETNN